MPDQQGAAGAETYGGVGPTRSAAAGNASASRSQLVHVLRGTRNASASRSQLLHFSAAPQLDRLRARSASSDDVPGAVPSAPCGVANDDRATGGSAGHGRRD